MRAVSVFWIFLRLGLTSFGGPIAHLGYFRSEFVDKRKWLDDAAYADLVALCQFLPGPASSQVGFALGKMHAGLAGAFAAFLGFTLPSFALMTAAAFGLSALDPAQAEPRLHGLKLAAVAVVAQAVLGMAKNLCPDAPRQALAAAAAAALLLMPHPLLPVAIVALGLLIGPALVKTVTASTAPAHTGGKALALICLAAFLALLIGLPWIAQHNTVAALADANFRAGALVFGGGHVVLPMLESATVDQGWLSQGDFLAGYAAAQAVPGPLFTFAAFVGATANVGPGGAAGAALATAAIFAPGFLLLLAALPFWAQLKSWPPALRAVAGANAAVVGVLGAALVSPITLDVVDTPADAAVAIGAFALLTALKWPPIIVVALSAAAGFGVRYLAPGG
jgi:chromate transporter